MKKLGLVGWKKKFHDIINRKVVTYVITVSAENIGKGIVQGRGNGISRDFKCKKENIEEKEDVGKMRERRQCTLWIYMRKRERGNQ